MTIRHSLFWIPYYDMLTPWWCWPEVYQCMEAWPVDS